MVRPSSWPDSLHCPRFAGEAPDNTASLHSWATKAHRRLSHGRRLLALSHIQLPGVLAQGDLAVLKAPGLKVGSSEVHTHTHSGKLHRAIIHSLITNKLLAPELGSRLLCHHFFGTSKTTTKIITAQASCIPPCPAVQNKVENGVLLCGPVDN